MLQKLTQILAIPYWSGIRRIAPCRCQPLAVTPATRSRPILRANKSGEYLSFQVTPKKLHRPANHPGVDLVPINRCFVHEMDRI